jgi:hypothetical protein
MVYCDYALAELRSDDPTGRQKAIEILQRVPLADAMLMGAVAAAEQGMPGV